MRLFILGANGLLGRHIEAEAIKKGLSVLPISRESVPDIEAQLVDPLKFISNLGITRQDYVINALGVTRHRIERGDAGADSSSVERINNQLPHALGKVALDSGFKVVQIGTDCVFSGKRGNYLENDLYDASDIYGRSKALGESANGISILRASSVGKGVSRFGYQLWDWVVNQDLNSSIAGYANAYWNGVTANIHAELITTIAEMEFPFAGTHHFVPQNFVSKGELIQLIANVSGRTDLKITLTDLPEPKNMTLATNDAALNAELWRLVGYQSPPRIEELFAKNLSSM